MAPTRSKSPIWIPILLILVIVTALYFGRAILIPVALATLLAFLLTPICSWLERHRLPRAAAIALVMAVVISAVGAAAWVLEEQAYQFAVHLPEYKSNIIARIQSLRTSQGHVIGEAGKAIAEVGREIGAGDTAALAADAPHASGQPVPVKVVEVPTPPLEYARSIFTPLLGPVATSMVVLVFSIFMLLKREDLRDRLIKLLGERSMHLTTPALDDAATRVSRYLLLQSCVNGAAGLTIGLGLLLIGVPGALLWGLLTTLLRFLPYIGTWIAAAFPFALSLATAPTFTQPLMVAALIAAVEVSAGQFVEPLLFSSGVGVSSIAILASALFWTWLWGPVGLLLATPLTVCLAVLGRHIPRLSFLETLLGDSTPLRPETRLYQRLLAGDQEEAAAIVDESKALTAAERFDTLLLPTLRLAEADRHRNLLDDEQERNITELMTVLVADTGIPRSPRPLAAPSPPPPLLACVASRDVADELASRMLIELLDPAILASTVIAADSLTGETIDRIAALSPAAVCISAIPPAASLHARVLCKRLRARFPDLPIIVGLWDHSLTTAIARQRLGDLGTEYIVTTLAQAVATIESLVPRPATTAAPQPPAPGIPAIEGTPRSVEIVRPSLTPRPT
jgi:predicted PurR-regulated permease PerM